MRKEDLARKVEEKKGGRYKGKREAGISRMCSHSKNANNIPAWTGRMGQIFGNEFWLIEV